VNALAYGGGVYYETRLAATPSEVDRIIVRVATAVDPHMNILLPYPYMNTI